MAQKIPEVLTGDQLERLLAAPNPKCPTGKRNRAMMAVMSDCGLRVAEMLNLEQRDINLGTGMIYVKQGKGKKDRVVWGGERTIEWIKAWLDVRPEAQKLFTTLKGKPVQKRYPGDMVKRYARRAGLDDFIHPHTLRHTFATDLYAKTHDICLVQKALGHASLANTMIYVHIVDDDEEAAMKELRSDASVS
jgi:integrase/recombinase XerD